MQNLDQIRAAAALKLLRPGKEPAFYRNDVVGIPALILTNGLLAAAAFCCEDGKDARKGMKTAFDGIAAHLKERGIISSTALVNELTQTNSLTIQRATTEALAFLAFLKRFTIREKDAT